MQKKLAVGAPFAEKKIHAIFRRIQLNPALAHFKGLAEIIL